MSNKILVPLLATILTGLLSCSSSKTAVKQEETPKTVAKDSVTPPKTPAIPTIPLPHNRAELRSMKAECDVDAVADAASVKGSSTICILRTDSLLMTINGPFGILVGKISAARENMIFFDALHSELVEGNPASEAMQSRLPIPLSYNDLVHLMRCEVPYTPSQYQLNKSDDNQSQLFAYSGDERFVDFVKMSLKDSTITTYQRKSRSGEVLFNVNFNEFTIKNGVRYPVSISLQFPPRKATAKFTVTDVSINPEGEKYWFAIPKGVKRTKLN